jgi:hypothetical protein
MSNRVTDKADQVRAVEVLVYIGVDFEASSPTHTIVEGTMRRSTKGFDFPGHCLDDQTTRAPRLLRGTQDGEVEHPLSGRRRADSFLPVGEGETPPPGSPMTVANAWSPAPPEPDRLDDFWDDIFHGCAWAALIDEAIAQRRWPDSEATRRRAFRYYEEELAKRNRHASEGTTTGAIRSRRSA